jgi:hypothetical protein
MASANGIRELVISTFIDQPRLSKQRDERKRQAPVAYVRVTGRGLATGSRVEASQREPPPRQGSAALTSLAWRYGDLEKASIVRSALERASNML